VRGGDGTSSRRFVDLLVRSFVRGRPSLPDAGMQAPTSWTPHCGPGPCSRGGRRRHRRCHRPCPHGGDDGPRRHRDRARRSRRSRAGGRGSMSARATTGSVRSTRPGAHRLWADVCAARTPMVGGDTRPDRETAS